MITISGLFPTENYTTIYGEDATRGLQRQAQSLREKFSADAFGSSVREASNSALSGELPDEILNFVLAADEEAYTLFLSRLEQLATPSAVATRADNFRNIPLLVDHDTRMPLAQSADRSVIYESTAEGLSFTAQLRPTRFTRAVAEAVQTGKLNSVSVGFNRPKRSEQITDLGATHSEGAVPTFSPTPPHRRLDGSTYTVGRDGESGQRWRVIREADLSEVSLVFRPAYKHTDVQVRGRSNNNRMRQVEYYEVA